MSVAGFRAISTGCQQLHSFHLFGSPVNDECLEVLSALQHLTELDVSFCELITDEGLSFVGKMRCLTGLDITGCELVSNRGLMHLAPLNQLCVLRCIGTTTDSVGVENLLRERKQNNFVTLSCPVSSASVGTIVRETSSTLTTFTPQFKRDVGPLAGLGRLAHLLLVQCKATESGWLEVVSGLKTLNSFRVYSADGMTDKVVEQLVSKNEKLRRWSFGDANTSPIRAFNTWLHLSVDWRS